MLGRSARALILLVLLFSSANLVKTASGAEGPENEFFEKKIRPVLVQHCYECHAADSKNIKGGLLLDTRASTLKGGDSGPAVVPKDLDESLLIEALRYETLQMPPKGKLPDAVIADFVKWVEMGAPDPRDGAAVVTKPTIDFESARHFWSFVPPVMPKSPEVQQAAWPKNDIDYFTLARMEAAGLKPVAPAGKRELIRRATFDLIGLPPTPEEVESFLADQSPDAFAKVVDRLLGSVHYGERWGRYWLDVARYSEDQAHTFAVTPNTSGYRYRDWVIEAFNSDMPYDEFVKQQIAGDLLKVEEQERYDHLVALGYFGLGAQYYKNSDAAKAAADELDDRIDTLTRGFLGLTVSCARCHDHKFDPIPTQDYYSLAGIFRSSKLHNAPLASQEVVDAYNLSQKQIKEHDDALKAFLAREKTQTTEAKVTEVARYLEAVWKLRIAKHLKKSLNPGQLAKAENLDEAMLNRWIEFVDSKNKGKVPALDAWFQLTPPGDDPLAELNDDITVPAEVVAVAKTFQEHLQAILDERDGKQPAAVTEAAKPESKPGKAIFESVAVTKTKPTVEISVDITNAKELYLVVTDAGNGNSCDHADWAEPKLIGADGEKKLTDLKWRSVKTGYGAVNVDKNVGGKPIRIGGKEYASGLGTHAPSIIAYDLPTGFTQFTAVGGLDNSGSDQGGCGAEASIQFRVYTQMPADFTIETPVEKPTTPNLSKDKADLLASVFGDKGVFAIPDNQLEKHLVGEKQQELQTIKTKLEELKKNAPPMYPIAHTIAESSVADMNVFIRGNPANQGEVAPRRFLKILAGDEPPLFKQGSGRLELAMAIADPNNPLTPRVMANRIWQHHFGKGIVGTPSNFGKLGEAPTHPHLLDYLARKFIDSGWSIKTLHREIMLSATYQLSTDRNEENFNIDGDNKFLWRMNRRRLDVEAWRDALLAVSGKLDRSLGGPSTDLANANNVRRTVYAKVSRHELDSLLRLFDFPDANITSSKRTETTVPQQQLFVLNSPFMIEQAKSLAARVQSEASQSDEVRINRAFLLAYGRPAEEIEVKLGLAYLAGEDTAEEQKENKLSRWERYAQILLGSNEFMYLD